MLTVVIVRLGGGGRGGAAVVGVVEIIAAEGSRVAIKLPSSSSVAIVGVIAAVEN